MLNLAHVTFDRCFHNLPYYSMLELQQFTPSIRCYSSFGRIRTAQFYREQARQVLDNVDADLARYNRSIAQIEALLQSVKRNYWNTSINGSRPFRPYDDFLHADLYSALLRGR